MRSGWVAPAAILAAAMLLGSPAVTAAQESEPDSTVLVRVERMGGFAGVHETWTLHETGEIWFQPVPGDNVSLLRTLEPALMDRVRGALGAGVGRVPAGVPGVECSDCFLYRVVVVGPGTAREVVVGEHRLAEASPEFRRLLGLVAGHGPPPFSLPGAAGVPGTAGVAGTPGAWTPQR